MRRLRRWIFNGLTLLSLLLCLSLAALWVRSCWAEDLVEWSGRHSRLDVISARGQVLTAWVNVELHRGVEGGFGFMSDTYPTRGSDGLHPQWHIDFADFGVATDKRINPLYA